VRTRSWAWVAASALHLPLVWGLQRASAGRGGESQLLTPLVTATEGPVTIAMPYRPATGAPRTPVAVLPQTPRAVRPDGVRAVAAPRVVTPPSAPEGTASLAGAVPLGSSAPAPTGARGDALRPSYGTGALWVRPLPMSPREMAAAVTGKSQQQLADSVVAVIVQGYLDAIAAERANPANKPPSWVTEVGGKKVGLDGQWIYLGPIKLPAALLALLPINMSGNPTQAEMNKRYSAMREDLYYAARRASTLEEFKKNVAELRKQKQYEYDLKKAQRTLPDSGSPQ
jgi:hypothetical protein